MSSIYIQPADDSCFLPYLDCARERGFGLEIASFAYSRVLDDNWRGLVTKYQRALAGFSGRLSMHGVFMEMVVHSHDSLIRDAVRNRITRNLEIATMLGAESIVFHSNYLPQITHDAYRRNWIERNFLFWSEMLDRFDVTVMIENLWEFDPQALRGLLDRVGSKRLQVCLDIGHVNIYSRVPLEEWLDVIGEDVFYFHLHDNDGNSDQHVVPGQGNIDWQEFTAMVRARNLSPGVMVEVESLPEALETISYCREHSIYPFDQQK